MLTTTLTAPACAFIIALAGAASAHADPATPMPVIESSAAQLCTAVAENPSQEGVFDAMAGLDVRDLDDIDGALVLITAVHHVCPQYETLILNALDAVETGPSDDVCAKEL